MALVILKSVGDGAIAVASNVVKRETLGLVDGVERGLMAGRELANLERFAQEEVMKNDYSVLAQSFELQCIEDKINALQEFSSALSAFQTRVSAHFVDTVIAAVRSLLGPDLPDLYFQQALVAASDLVGDAKNLELHVSVEDRAKAASALENSANSDRVTAVTLCIDRGLSAGQCYVKSPLGKIELHLETQLAALQRSLVNWHKQPLQNITQTDSNEK
jgi:flagellar biosynthesis/type III secretory pathway protein FliH